MSLYPGTLDSFPTREAHVDLYRAAHVNALQQAVVAVETELGTNPAGSVTDLKTRLAVRIGEDGKIKEPQQLVTVGKTNADYNTIQAAIDAISDAAAAKPYLVLAYPGIYDERITLKSYVYLVALDRNATKLRETQSFVGPLVTAADHSGISNFTLRHQGEGDDPMDRVLYQDGGSFELLDCSLEATGIDNQLIFVTGTGSLDIERSKVDSEYPAIHFDSITTANIRHCIPMNAPIECASAGGTLNIQHSFTSGPEVAIGLYTTGATVTIRVSHIQSGSNARAIYCFNYTGDLTVLRSTLIKGPGAADEIYSNNAINVVVAACIMQAGLHANCTNLVATPYNVIDANIK